MKGWGYQTVSPPFLIPGLAAEKDSRITQQIPASPSNGHAGTR